ncbi:filamentous hemagglutinin-like protein [Caballeronia humi]|uniref:Filamentous hemagglutinin-like protein n=1 Tax=Caballeronia humi TaxID=326474 RepID=A0A158ITT4_9BURK|nr:filamentous hemagglutinin-like protein [Caballeronia humi]
MQDFVPRGLAMQKQAPLTLGLRHARQRYWSALLCGMLTHGACVLAAGPLPNGGNFVAGAGAISSNGTALNITQSTPRAVIDWRSFSIGNGNSVIVNNGAGATLSRVTGIDRSVIDGRLNATGSFFLVNPQGVLIGTRGVVTTGGRFVASTLDLSDDAFMNGGSLNLSGSSDAVVVNLGRISSSGGDVFLISSKRAENVGSIEALVGTAELATGAQVLLKDSSSGSQVFVEPGIRGDVVNKGTISAAQIALNAADGNVFALAGNQGELRATGTATRDGHVWLVADRGTAHVHTHVVASNPVGNGGVVETSGYTLHLDDAVIDAARWNLTAPEFNVGVVAAAILARSLSSGTSVNLNTTGAYGKSGDINLHSTLRWDGDATLALKAQHDVTIGGTITVANNGAGNLTLRADANSIDNGASVVNRGTIDWSRSTGVVAALHDTNGAYIAGTVRSNPSWAPAPFSGLNTQATAYQLVNSKEGLENVTKNLAGVYALGKDLDLGGWPNQFQRIGGATATFTGQFDGMGHAIGNLYQYQESTGLFGEIGTTGVVRNLSVNATMTASGIFAGLGGGIIALRNRGLITNTHASGSIGSTRRAGGLVVENDGTIERSSSSAALNDQGSFAGLVVVNNGRIVQSFASGLVSGGSHASGAGLVDANYGSITQSYAAGAATMYWYASGLVSYNAGTISESFATTRLTLLGPPDQKAGVAFTNDGAIADNVFWDVQATTATNSVYSGDALPAANGFTTAQMSMAASFGPTWDFSPTGTWVMPAGGTHPILRWQQDAQ